MSLAPSHSSMDIKDFELSLGTGCEWETALRTLTQLPMHVTICTSLRLGVDPAVAFSLDSHSQCQTYQCKAIRISGAGTRNHCMMYLRYCGAHDGTLSARGDRQTCPTCLGPTHPSVLPQFDYPAPDTPPLGVTTGRAKCCDHPLEPRCLVDAQSMGHCVARSRVLAESKTRVAHSAEAQSWTQ